MTKFNSRPRKQRPHSLVANPPPTKTYFDVVGVISNVRGCGIEQEVHPGAFLPGTVAQQFVSSIGIRTPRDADEFSGAIVRQVWAMDHDVTLSNDRGSLQSNPQRYDYAQPEFEFVALSAFAGIGLLLVIIGVYSVMAYNVSLQTREIGIRMALGAQQRNVVRSVLRRGTVLPEMGAVLGLFLAWAVTRLIQNQLWRVTPTDPWTLAAVTAIVLLVGLLACAGPARRATQVEPSVALRQE
jgi:predicted lysophospholipase L1 biosynthesis ABC-type transport system permease subunit